MSAKASANTLVMPLERRGGIAVERRADLVGEAREGRRPPRAGRRYGIGEMVHRKGLKDRIEDKGLFRDRRSPAGMLLGEAFRPGRARWNPPLPRRVARAVAWALASPPAAAGFCAAPGSAGLQRAATAAGGESENEKARNQNGAGKSQAGNIEHSETRPHHSDNRGGVDPVFRARNSQQEEKMGGGSTLS